MNWQAIKVLIIKDLTLFSRDRFFAFVSVMALVAYAAIYFVMPSDVDETLELAWYGAAVPPAHDGLEVDVFDTVDDLTEAVEDGDYLAGIALAEAGMTVYFSPNTPVELKDAVTNLIGFISYTDPVNVTITQEVIGTDFADAQIALRERFVPLFVVFVLVMETMSLASLIAEEVETRTVRALLVTPLNVSGLFLSKAVVGVGMAFLQALALALVTGLLATAPVLIITVLLLGSILVTGLGFLIASVARDLMSVVSWSTLVILVMSIPAFSLMFPGPVSDWMKLLPSYYLIQTINDAANYSASWSDVAGNLAVLTATTLVILGAGVMVLRRKLHVV